jgi:hypothetical protein
VVQVLLVLLLPLSLLLLVLLWALAEESSRGSTLHGTAQAAQAPERCAFCCGGWAWWCGTVRSPRTTEHGQSLHVNLHQVTLVAAGKHVLHALGSGIRSLDGAPRLLPLPRLTANGLTRWLALYLG